MPGRNPRARPASRKGKTEVATRKAGQEASALLALIERIVRECPRRKPTSEDEAQAHAIMKAEFEALGLDVETHDFLFNENLYANIALHFGLGSLGTLVSGIAPALGLALHLGAASSYWADSTRRGYLLRRLFPWKPSRNILGVMPATGTPQAQPRLRIVLIAHVDAAFTGWLFKPATVKMFAGDPPPGLGFTKRSMALATRTQFALAGFDLLRLLFGRALTLPLRPLEWILSIPGLLALLLNLEVVWRDEIVPGANDDLTGVAALVTLASRLAASKPDDVELVFGAIGAEEASLGGGDALARDMGVRWGRDRTVIIGLDSLSNGELRYLHPEGEVSRVDVPSWLRDVVERVALAEPRFHQVTPYPVPVGGSDVAAFLARGWDGLCLSCIDPEIGAPVHYHQPTDTPENLDMAQVMLGVDFAEKLVHAVIRARCPA